MLSRQTGKLNMYLATRDYLKQNTILLNDLPKFTDFLTELQTVITGIQDLAEKQKEDITGITAGKNDLRQKLSAKVIEVSKKMTAFAEFTVDNELKLKVRLTVSKLSRSNDLALRDYAQLIYDITQVHVNDLAKYGVTEQSQTDFQTLISDFNSSIPKNRLSHSGRKMVNQNLAALFIRADRLIHNIDLEFDIIRPEQGQLYAGYKEIRRVKKSYTRKDAIPQSTTLT